MRITPLEQERLLVHVAAMVARDRRAHGVLTQADVMDGVPEMLSELHVEATFPDGTKLVAVHAPIP